MGVVRVDIARQEQVLCVKIVFLPHAKIPIALNVRLVVWIPRQEPFAHAWGGISLCLYPTATVSVTVINDSYAIDSSLLVFHG